MKQNMRRLICLLLTLLLLTQGLPVWAADAAAFSDVSETDWFAPAVEAAVNAGIMTGKSDTIFDPYGTVTGAEAVAVVVRLAGAEVVQDSGANWYVPYLDAAQQLGLFEDLDTTGTFSAVDAIPRIQIAVLLYNYLKMQELEVLSNAMAPDVPYAEYGNSEFAVQSLYCWGILTGDSDGTFEPKNALTRAELAQIIFRVLEPTQRVKTDRAGKIAARLNGLYRCQCVSRTDIGLPDALSAYEDYFLSIGEAVDPFLTETAWLIDCAQDGTYTLYFLQYDGAGQFICYGFRYDGAVVEPLPTQKLKTVSADWYIAHMDDGLWYGDCFNEAIDTEVLAAFCAELQSHPETLEGSLLRFARSDNIVCCI